MKWQRQRLSVRLGVSLHLLVTGITRSTCRSHQMVGKRHFYLVPQDRGCVANHARRGWMENATECVVDFGVLLLMPLNTLRFPLICPLSPSIAATYAGWGQSLLSPLLCRGFKNVYCVSEARLCFKMDKSIQVC
jgi:hypothetical protein